MENTNLKSSVVFVVLKDGDIDKVFYDKKKAEQYVFMSNELSKQSFDMECRNYFKIGIKNPTAHLKKTEYEFKLCEVVDYLEN